eukprot:9436221-Alexandrium_andersonii.AAC.1
MSASLVGSEMCIRDRVTRPRYHLGRKASQGARAAGVDNDQGKAAVCRQAVSYTHLTLPTICSV